MTRTKFFTAILAMTLSVVVLPAIASAQYGQYDPYGRGGYGNSGYGGYGNSQYGNYGYGNVSSAVRELRDLSRRFEKDLDRSPTYSRNNNRYGNYGGYGGYYGHNNGAGNVRKLADKFSDAARDLERSFNNGRNYNNSRDEAGRVLNLGSQLDNELRRYGLDSYLQNDWNRIQYDLRIISNNFGNGYYRNNRNGGYNGGYRNGLPSWWPF